MIQITHKYNKSAIHNKQTEIILCTEIKAFKENKILKDRLPLNISIALDTSTSMNESVNRRVIQNDHRKGSGYINWNDLNSLKFPYIESNYKSKIEQAKIAAIKAIESLEVDDIVSVITFDSKANILQTAIKITTDNKESIYQKIKNVTAGGSTDLHSGWLTSATEVAKNLSSKYINRVIIITDGDTNIGVKDPIEIAKNVSNLYQQSISTTTFGIGEDFKEDLLQKMSNSGGGNFYYVDDDKKLLEMFHSEFNSLSSICATDISISFELENSKIEKQWNGLEIKENNYLIGSLSSNNSNTALFTISFITKKGNKKLKLGKMLISYKDENGIHCKTVLELILPIIKKSDWDELKEDQEIKVQETLLTIANTKNLATEALLKGDLLGAKGLLTQSIDYANTRGISDNRVINETISLNTTLSMADTTNINSLRKDISYQSYKTRFNK